MPLALMTIAYDVNNGRNTLAQKVTLQYHMNPKIIHFVSGNIRTLGKTKLTGFPRDLTLSVLLYF